MERINQILDNTARALSAAGFSANMATLAGFGVSIAAALMVANGYFAAGALLILCAGIFDLLDGRIARLRESLNPFGALLDSSLDRLSDAAYYAAILYYYLAAGETFYAMMAFSACAGSFEISYVRARSEGLGKTCQVGFWERGERTALLIAGLVLGNLNLAVLYLGILTHFTALERLLYARSRLDPKVPKRTEKWPVFLQKILLSGEGRGSLAWRVKVALIVSSLFLLKP